LPAVVPAPILSEMSDATRTEPDENLAPDADDILAAARKARRCTMPGCPTTLSVYNHGHLCFVHSNQKAAQTLTRFPYRPERHFSD